MRQDRQGGIHSHHEQIQQRQQNEIHSYHEQIQVHGQGGTVCADTHKDQYGTIRNRTGVAALGQIFRNPSPLLDYRGYTCTQMKVHWTP